MNVGANQTKSRTILWQAPNPALIGWAVVTVINHFTRSPHLSWLGTALLFAWAFMEMYQGANYFRRLLGLIILILMIVLQFR